MIVLLAVMSVFAFVVIQLPPGDYLTSYIASLQQQMGEVDESVVLNLRRQYGLDRPMWQQYFLWMRNMFQGDFGQSFQWRQPVKTLIATRMPMTIVLSVITLLFAYAVAVPIGIYSARHQYSAGDYVASILGFVVQQQAPGTERGRILLSGVSECAVELCQTMGFMQASAHTGNSHRSGQYGQCDPYSAGHTAGRAQASLCGGGQGQRTQGK